MKYRIEKKTHYRVMTIADSLSENVQFTQTIRADESFYIQYQQKLFGIFPYWRYLQRYALMYGSGADRPMPFSTLEEATNFAETYICKGILPDTETYEVLKEAECQSSILN